MPCTVVLQLVACHAPQQGTLGALADTWCVQKGTVGNPVVHPEWHAAACAQLPPLNSVSYIQPEYPRPRVLVHQGLGF
jgi:hypothetical protein